MWCFLHETGTQVHADGRSWDRAIGILRSEFAVRKEGQPVIIPRSCATVDLHPPVIHICALLKYLSLTYPPWPTLGMFEHEETCHPFFANRELAAFAIGTCYSSCETFSSASPAHPAAHPSFLTVTTSLRLMSDNTIPYPFLVPEPTSDTLGTGASLLGVLFSSLSSVLPVDLRSISITFRMF